MQCLACLEMMIFSEIGAEISFEPKECMDAGNQGKVYESVTCPRLEAYMKRNQDEVAADRQSFREDTDKWNSLDDDYSTGGYAGDPEQKFKLKKEAILRLKTENDEIEGNLAMDEMKYARSNIALHLVVIAVLLGFLGFSVMAHWICNNRKATEKLAANLLYT